MDLSLRRCRFQLRISVQIAFTALSDTAGLKLMKNFPALSENSWEACIHGAFAGFTAFSIVAAIR